MNPDPPMKHSGTVNTALTEKEAQSWFGRLLGGAPRTRREPRSYPRAVAGSSDPTRRRRVPYVNAAGETEYDPRFE